MVSERRVLLSGSLAGVGGGLLRALFAVSRWKVVILRSHSHSHSRACLVYGAHLRWKACGLVSRLLLSGKVVLCGGAGGARGQ